MLTPSVADKRHIQKAIQEVKDGIVPNWAAAAKKHCISYNILHARAKGRPTNETTGRRNKKLAKDKEATLKLYCERYILASKPLEQKHIQAAANSILHAARKKLVSKP